MKNHKITLTLIGLSIVGLTSETAHAGFVTFTDRTAWQNAVTTFSVVDFNNFTSDHNLGTSGSFDAGPFTLSAVGPWASDNGIEAYDPSPTNIQSVGQDRNIDGTTYFSGDTDDGTVITIDFDGSITAFGFDYTSMNGGIPFESFKVGAFEFSFPSSSGFFGIVETSLNSFNQITIQGDDGAWGADNFSYSAAPNLTAAVPEPASIAIWGIALAGGCGLRLRRKQAVSHNS
ncbi:hypothetical protein AB1L42_03980 [Thalassoglobus sp. JC818]|uniref:hypothetical protein n=1 Tax=Thalassoglobus sp. JC818 TaxID=3232136 RepID=UPI003458307F